MSLEPLEEKIILMNDLEFIYFLMDERLILREVTCISCLNFMVLKECKKYVEGYCWRCCNSHYKLYKKRTSLRINSFFQSFRTNIKSILKILMRYSVKKQLFIIDSYMNCDYSVTMKVIKNLREKIPFQDFSDDKMGRNGTFVQVDETMLN
ncbi:hypothetical protein H311_00312 [Anncaliia algerae PRA109]|nr:hypothetical protein H311_00312 [Anncaliia algerae PRA109]